MSTAMRFDDSLLVLARTVAESLGEDALAAGVALRDASGRLCFFAGRDLAPSEHAMLSDRLSKALGAYARTDRVLSNVSEPGAEAIRLERGALNCRVGSYVIRLLDRRIVGADWVRAPAAVAAGPARFVFASLKGGVGRSTALSVVAAHLASKGGRVLAVDLDLEAPGLGAILLNEDTAPEFGVLDFLVENGLSELGDEFFTDLVGPSSLASRGGRIDVIPAFGRRSLRNPADVLAKLGRAYVEDVREDGSTASLLDQIRALVDRFAQSESYDAVLIDARAGLHEAAAAPLLGLGADVLLFGLDEPQTFQGYAALLAHLSRFVDPSQPMPEWVDRLTPVHAKASADPARRAAFAQKWQDLVMRHWPGASQQNGTEPEHIIRPDGFTDVAWDESRSDAEVLPQDSMLLRPVTVLRDDRYESFDPLRRGDVLSAELVQTTFGELIAAISPAVFPETEVAAE